VNERTPPQPSPGSTSLDQRLRQLRTLGIEALNEVFFHVAVASPETCVQSCNEHRDERIPDGWSRYRAHRFECSVKFAWPHIELPLKAEALKFSLIGEARRVLDARLTSGGTDAGPPTATSPTNARPVAAAPRTQCEHFNTRNQSLSAAMPARIPTPCWPTKSPYETRHKNAMSSDYPFPLARQSRRPQAPAPRARNAACGCPAEWTDDW
jgi:hypothetical protein